MSQPTSKIYQELQKAFDEKNLNEINNLLQKKDVNVHEVDEHGFTLLHWAAYQDELLPAALMLIQKGAKIDTRVPQKKPMEPFGFTPFTIAVNRNQPKMVELFIRHGANLNNVVVAAIWPGPPLYQDQRCALYIAARNGNKPMMQLLLKAGAIPNLLYPNGTSIFSRLAKCINPCRGDSIAFISNFVAQQKAASANAAAHQHQQPLGAGAAAAAGAGAVGQITQSMQKLKIKK